MVFALLSFLNFAILWCNASAFAHYNPQTPMYEEPSVKLNATSELTSTLPFENCWARVPNWNINRRTLSQKDLLCKDSGLLFQVNHIEASINRAACCWNPSDRWNNRDPPCPRGPQKVRYPHRYDNRDGWAFEPYCKNSDNRKDYMAEFPIPPNVGGQYVKPYCGDVWELRYCGIVYHKDERFGKCIPKVDKD